MKRWIVLAGLTLLALPVVPAAATAAPLPDRPVLVDPADARWFVQDGTDITAFFYGVPGDVPLMGDWNCDGVDSPGMYRPSNGFAYLRNSMSTGVADVSFFFGLASDHPLAGDWDGDGCDTLAIYRPSESRFYLSNVTETAVAETSFDFGSWGDRPLAGDFDGDGIDELALYRPATGFVHLRWDHTAGPADHEFYYGEAGDTVLAGDWGASGADTLAVFRPAESTFIFSRSLATATGWRQEVLALTRMTPVAGAFEFSCATGCDPRPPAMAVGARGSWVAALRAQLAELRFLPGEGDIYDMALKQAVYAFQKHYGLSRDGIFRGWDYAEPITAPVSSDEATRVEIDLAKQVLYFVVDGELAGIIPVASGNGARYTTSTGGVGIATTPEGSFSLYRQSDGWYQSYLGFMYRPFFFHRGYAIHGSNSVPPYPASHGCVRVPNWNMDWLKPQLDYGMPVYVFGVRTPAPG